jgi:hypothetical protein
MRIFYEFGLLIWVIVACSLRTQWTSTSAMDIFDRLLEFRKHYQAAGVVTFDA